MEHCGNHEITRSIMMRKLVVVQENKRKNQDLEGVSMDTILGIIRHRREYGPMQFSESSLVVPWLFLVRIPRGLHKLQDFPWPTLYLIYIVFKPLFRLRGFNILLNTFIEALLLLQFWREYKKTLSKI